MRNDFEIIGDIVKIFVKCEGEVYECLISLNKLDRAKELDGTWYAKFDYNRHYVYGTTSSKNGAKRRTIKIHRWITGEPKGIDIDHVNHSALDNRDENLRFTTRGQNLQNREGATKISKTGIRGVTWNISNNLWCAEVILNGKRAFQKYFKDIKDAERAVKEARARLMPYSKEGSR